MRVLGNRVFSFGFVGEEPTLQEPRALNTTLVVREDLSDTRDFVYGDKVAAAIRPSLLKWCGQVK